MWHGKWRRRCCLCCVQAVIEIQRRLPNARVLYVSATGATEASNLGYMQRLGLWGPGTAFESRQKFIHLLDQRGVGELLSFACTCSSYQWALQQAAPCEICMCFRAHCNRHTLYSDKASLSLHCGVVD